MKTTKTLNVAVELHQELKIRAVGAGEQLGPYVEAVLQVGLSHQEEVRRLLATGTSRVPPLVTDLSPQRESEDE
jgi:hypothetical protein